MCECASSPILYQGHYAIIMVCLCHCPYLCLSSNSTMLCLTEILKRYPTQNYLSMKHFQPVLKSISHEKLLRPAFKFAGNESFISVTLRFYRARLHHIPAAPHPPELIAAILDNACDSTGCAAASFTLFKTDKKETT